MKNAGKELIIVAVILVGGCSGAISRNEDTIEKTILERQLLKGHSLKYYRVVDHLDSPRSLTIFVSGTIDSLQPFTDTIRFALTMDGFIVQ